jgi:hypothetical protein
MGQQRLIGSPETGSTDAVLTALTRPATARSDGARAGPVGAGL